MSAATVVYAPDQPRLRIVFRSSSQAKSWAVGQGDDVSSPSLPKPLILRRNSLRQLHPSLAAVTKATELLDPPHRQG